ncbi:putative lipid II flippase FtsW [Fibrobacterota bacterium]
MIDKIAKMDKVIFLLTLLMMGFGIVFVYSSSFAIAQQRFGGSDFFLARHIIRVILALICFFVFINIDYHTLGKYSNVAYILAVIMLVYALALPESSAINGAKRWISLGFIRFQVSEFARIVLIIALAAQVHKLGERIREGGIFVQQIIKIGIICGLIIVEPDFSTALIIGCIGLCLLFVSGAKMVHLIGIVCAFIPLVILSLLTSPYRQQRLLGFLNMADMKDGVGYQAYQSLIGLGHGGLFGVGLGQGEQKYFYLPEPHTDFVFSILGEEIGFVGLMVMFFIFGILLYRGMRIATRAPDKMGQVMAFGLSLMLGIYIILHAFVNTGIVPTTGVPLPFLSYGGMSLIFTMSSMGILLNISTQLQDVKPQTRKRRRR